MCLCEFVELPSDVLKDMSSPDSFFGHSIVGLMKRGPKVITIDPRLTQLGAHARTNSVPLFFTQVKNWYRLPERTLRLLNYRCVV